MKNKNGQLVQKPHSPTHRFFEKLGYKDQEQLRFVLVHDAKNNYYSRYSYNSGSGSAYSKPAMTLYKPLHLIEKHVPFITLYSYDGKPVHLFNQNALGYAIFMEINYRESRRSAFKDIRAQFIDVDLNKAFARLNTRQQALDKARALQSSPSEGIASVAITRSRNGQYLLVAERTKSRVQQLKKSFLKRHKSKIKDAMVVETKNGFHMYWPVQEGSIDRFVPIQKALVQKFSSDPNITNLARAMRIPGFYHMKDPDDPYMVKVKHWGRSRPFTQDGLVRRLNLKLDDTNANARRAGRTRRAQRSRLIK